MATPLGKCDAATQTLTAFDDGGTMVYPTIEGLESTRIGPVSTPFMLHVTTDHPDWKCPQLDIERVIECPKGCDFDEFKWSFPCECTTNYLLPAGTYDITVCKQDAYPLQTGESVTITFLLEPVNDTFAAIYSQKAK